jgi:hypothetical protein
VSVCSGFTFQPAHCIVSLMNFTATVMASSVLREIVKVNLSLMRRLKLSQFVCILLKLCSFSWCCLLGAGAVKCHEARPMIGR